MEAFIAACRKTYQEVIDSGLFTEEEVLEAFDDWLDNRQEINRNSSCCRVLTYLIEHTEIPEDLYLYRGDSIVVPKEYKVEKFLSITTDIFVASEYAEEGGTLMKIRVPKGTKAFFLDCLHESSSQEEVLLFKPTLKFVRMIEETHENIHNTEDGTLSIPLYKIC